MFQKIDLRPGHYSSVGGLWNNIAMAFNTMQVMHAAPASRAFNPDAVIENGERRLS